MSAIIIDAEITFRWKRVRTLVMRRKAIAEITAATEAKRRSIAADLARIERDTGQGAQ